MPIKFSFKEWIMLYIMVGIFVAITAYLITFFFDISGSIVVTLALVVIFLIFKIYQYSKKDEEKDKPPKDDEE
ncbi:MAG: hypothetical protein KGY66_06350 [Candidatus Thermoplasmatota archaeon]|nr:hypothetical protein [Candidatus Thermoplasmatota archaeon]MBS3790518.1 hypothetical protein [Candidatus Thermoplasmatota archaeon]